jgi:hypothetical protein
MGKVTKKNKLKKSRFDFLKEHFTQKYPYIPIKDLASAVREANRNARPNAQTDKIRQATEHFLVLKIIGEAPDTKRFCLENKKSKHPMKHLKMFKDRISRVYVKLFQKAMHLNEHAFNGKCMISSADITAALRKSKWLFEEALVYSEAERLIVVESRLLKMVSLILKQIPYENSETEQDDQLKTFLSSIEGDGTEKFLALDYFIGFIKEKKEERILFKSLKNDFLSLMPQQQVTMVDIPHPSEMTVIGQEKLLARS